MNTTVVHDCLSWTVCYNDNCFVYISSKDEAEWYLQQLKEDQNSYDMIDQLKELVILKKVIKNDLNKIEEINTYKTQKEDTAEA